MAIKIPSRSKPPKAVSDRPVKSGLPENPEAIKPSDLNPRFQNITARKLLSLARSNPTDLKWLPYVSVVKTRKLQDDEGRVVYRFESITTLPNTPPSRSHYCSIRARDPKYKGRICEAPAILCNCDCERWVYHYEYANWYRGCALMIRCNGEYPSVTNPALKLGGCKHSIRALTALISRGL